MSRISDILAPKGDTVHLLLKRRGETEAAIYKEDDREFRSPTLLKKDEAHDAPTDRNP